MSLSPEQFRTVETLFHELLEADRATRRQRLAEIVADDPYVAAEVDSLLADESLAKRATSPDHLARVAEQVAEVGRPQEPTEFLSATAHERIVERSKEEQHLRVNPEWPRQVGRYEIVRLLGEGGMGQVFEANQQEPVRRRVALKLIRAGLSHSAATARFKAEQQALAVMDHPNIARVLDADVNADGRPYFVMELIDGVPIHRYCDHHQLSVDQRIDLFMDVLSAVQHAHQKGVIHRDLKPSNILVAKASAPSGDRHASSGAGRLPTGADRPGIVKVIDFGVAKAVEEPLLADTNATRIGDLVGTPEYMSPEQASLGTIDIDVRSDVYSLGLVLYELLTGNLPVPRAELRQAGFDEMRRLICEVDAPRPSARVATADTAGFADTTTQSLARRLRGDLDWVLLKALAKERDRRYDSVGAFADDLHRHLDDQPVSASPPTLRYRTQKFIRRNRAAMIAAGLVSLALVGGLVGTSWGLLKAQASARDAAGARDTAQEERLTAEGTANFLGNLFRAADPRERAGREISVDEVLERAIGSIDDLESEPATQLRLLALFGDVYRAQGKFDQAEAILNRVIAFEPTEGIDRRQLEHDRLVARAQLAGILRDRMDLPSAESLLNAAISEGQSWFEPTDQAMGNAYNTLGTVLRRQRKFEPAQEAYQLALASAEANEQPAAGNVASILNNLSSLASFRGDIARAADLNQRAIDTFSTLLPKGHPAFGTLYLNRATMLRGLGDLPAALDVSKRGLEIDRKALGNEHVNIAGTLLGQAQIEINLGLFTEAKESLRESLRILEGSIGLDNSRARAVYARRAIADLFQGDVDSAIEHLERGVVHPFDPTTITSEDYETRNALAAVLRFAGRTSAALALNRELLTIPEDQEGRPILGAWSHLQRAHLLHASEPQASQLAFERALELADCSPSTWCFLDRADSLETRATYYALTGRNTQALATLELLFEKNARRLSVPDSPDFDGLRGDPRFEDFKQRWATRVLNPNAQ